MKATPLLLIGLALLLIGSAPLSAADDEDPDDIPLVGKPDNFSGASGQFTVTLTADPTRLPVESPLTLTLTVRANDPARRPTRHPPQRMDLGKVPGMEEAFYITDPADGTRHPNDNTWVFFYQLRPKRRDVRAVPRLPFAFYNPYLARFQVWESDPIPLQVQPAPVVEVPLAAPDWAFTLAEGPALTSRQAAWPLPGRLVWLLVLLLPPLGCGLWYRTWQRLYPSAARRAQQQRSRAARAALQQLERLERLPVAESAAPTAAAVAGYLQQRLDFAAGEPTPRETAALLQQRGCTPNLVEQAAHFFAACDRVRFSAAPVEDGVPLPEMARQIILNLETETCPAGSS